MFASRRELLAT